ncbi:MAG: penicillin-binding protein activator LpoB [Burkholderiaceae bacterium]|jgi:TolB-like protein|nr:penicillin-binding protein activator LpoB [Burkholderiaceae bacterium]
MTFRLITRILVLTASACLAACTTSSIVSGKVALDQGAKWAILPLENHTETPQSALSAEAIAEHGLRARGVSNIARYPAALSRDGLFEPTERRTVDEARKWAREQGIQYGLTGSVQEWRYKVGIDGEPAAAVTLQLLDLASGQVVWSASGAKSGWSRDSLAGVGQKLVEELLGSISLERKDGAR